MGSTPLSQTYDVTQNSMYVESFLGIYKPVGLEAAQRKSHVDVSSVVEL